MNITPIMKKYFSLKNSILLLFCLVYCSISLVNHYNFRTYAWDLGMYNSDIYDYAHFRFNNNALEEEGFTNPLGNHFELIPMLVSPLFWILGTYTMLVFQIAAVLFGGYGIYVFMRERTEIKYLPELAMFHFFCIWGIYSALSFDFHNNVIAAMLVPWFIHFFDIEKWRKATFFFLLIIIAKENMALWMVFICMGLILLNRKNIFKIKKAGIYSFCALAYFILVVKFIMPLMAGTQAVNGYVHFNQYSVLGNTAGEAIKTIFTRPLYVLKLFFVNLSADPLGNGIKQELHTMVLVSGGMIFFLRPQFFVMLIPIYAQKLLNDQFARWGILYHYSIEFVPIISLAIIHAVTKISKPLYARIIYIAVTIITMLASFEILENPIKSVWPAPAREQFYKPIHYKIDFDRNKVYHAISLVPDNAGVSAQSQLVSHLTSRKIIYQYPTVLDAQYIILLNKGNTYPLTQEQYDQELEKLLHSDKWTAIYNESDIYIFKRNL